MHSAQDCTLFSLPETSRFISCSSGHFPARDASRRRLAHLSELCAIELMQINDRQIQSDYHALMSRSALLQALLALSLIAPALAASPSVERGKTFALNNCARCHSIDRVTQSPLKIAPPFRTLHSRYPVESLAEALAEGIQTGHPSMPEFRLDPDQINDLLSYLKSLE